MQPHDVTPEQLDALIASAGERLLVLYLWGPDCPNCEIFKRSLSNLGPALVELDVDFVSLDAYRYPEIARRHAVYGIPHFLLFKYGRKLGKMSEFRGEAFWLGVVREHAARVVTEDAVQRATRPSCR